MGLAVPDDVSVIGFDNTAFARYQLVELSTIDYAGYDIGQRTLAQLIARLANPDRSSAQETLAPTLIKRRSTAPPPNAVEQ